MEFSPADCLFYFIIVVVNLAGTYQLGIKHIVPKILISACLTGENCKYNEQNNLIPAWKSKRILDEWKAQKLIIPVCPEILGGLEIPRPPAEIVSKDGFEVLDKKKGVVNKNGFEVSNFFLTGACKVLNIVYKNNIKIAVFKENSPSCGVNNIYDGSFKKKLKKGCGVTSALLLKNGVKLFNEYQVELADRFLRDFSQLKNR